MPLRSMSTPKEPGTQNQPSPIAVVDLETTGLFPQRDRIVEIAVVTLDPADMNVLDEFDTMLNPERDIGARHIHGISPNMVVGAPTFGEIASTLAKRLHNAILVFHNSSFDLDFLNQEFMRAGGDFHPGNPLCTYRATHQKLTVACRDHNIRMENTHSALGDARATAALARKVLDISGAKNARVRIQTPYQAVHTLRRHGASINHLGRIVERARYPDTDELTRDYLAGLDYVLDDFVIDAVEQDILDELAKMLGLTPAQRREAHSAYFQSLVAAAQRDNVITIEEHRLLSKVHATLDLPTADLPAVDDGSEINMADLPAGTCICFSGEVFVDDVHIPRAQLEDRARDAGLMPVANVTKKRGGVLVTSPDSSSGKARNARKWGIPIVSPAQFLAQCCP